MYPGIIGAIQDAPQLESAAPGRDLFQIMDSLITSESEAQRFPFLNILAGKEGRQQEAAGTEEGEAGQHGKGTPEGQGQAGQSENPSCKDSG